MFKIISFSLSNLVKINKAVRSRTQQFLINIINYTLLFKERSHIAELLSLDLPQLQVLTGTVDSW